MDTINVQGLHKLLEQAYERERRAKEVVKYLEERARVVAPELVMGRCAGCLRRRSAAETTCPTVGCDA